MTVGADGRVLSVSATAPRFTRREVALLLASRRAEKEPRGTHGILLSEATDPENQYAFMAPLPTTDFAAKALHDAQSAYQARYKDADMSSLLWRVEKKPSQTSG